ncbi:MAG: TonB-dependent receptor [Deltaproteobacteria bacterium]|nr:TonB-dependent receptor [Deltaproteobacteria bacterium]
MAWLVLLDLGLAPPRTAIADDSVETIVVNGDSRRLSEIPPTTSVETIDGRDLDRGGLLDSRDLAGRVPGLVVSTNSAVAHPYLRGVGSDLISAGVESSIAVVVDGVYRPRSAGALIDLFDIDRIDVLRGPQGLHFGRNATGGVIHVRSRRPDSAVGAEADLTYGSFELARFRYALNVPLSEGRGAVRLAGMHKQQDGYLRNVLRREGSEGEDFDALRLQASYQLNANASILVGGDYSRDTGTRGLTPRLAEPLAGSPAFLAGGTVPDDRRRVFLDRSPHARGEQAGGRIELDVGTDAVEIASITAFRANDLAEKLDLDGTELPFVTNDVDERSRSATQEVRVASSPGGRVDWLVGGFFQHEQARQRLNPRFPLAGIDDRTKGRIRTNALALFGEIALALPAHLRLSTSTRYSYERREHAFDERLNGVSVSDFTTDGSWDGWSPEIALTWHPRDSFLGYLKGSRGYKAGGFNTAINQPGPIRPESLWAAELGGRADLLGDRVRVEGAFFYYDYRDMQLQIIPPSAAVPFPSIENAGQATLYGLELGVELSLPGEIAVDGSLAWLESEFEHLDAIDVNAPAASPDQSGNRLPRAPELALALGGEIRLRLGELGFMTPRIDYRYQTATYFNVFQDRFTRQNGYGVVNFQIGFETGDGKLGLTVYGYNLADQTYVTNFLRVDNQFGNISFLGSPRTLGITFNVKL